MTIIAQHSYKNNPIAIGGSFVLTDHNNQLFNSNKLKGQLSLIYFGRTYYLDNSDMILKMIDDIVIALNNYGVNITPVFITIDPEHDTPEILREYLSHFKSNFIALTGTREQIKFVVNKFKISHQKLEYNDIKNLKHHTSFIYLMNFDYQYIKHFYITGSPKDHINFINIIECLR